MITAAALQAHLVPEAQDLRAFNFDSFEQGFKAIDEIAAMGLRPSLLDYGEEHASPWPDLAPRQDEPPLLYLGFEGLGEEVDFSMRRALALVEANSGRELPRERAQSFWQRRHVVAQRFARGEPRDRDRRSPDVAYDYLHVAVPPSRVLAFRERCHAETASAGVALLECGLWTAPDFFSAVFALPVEGGGQERLGVVMDTLLRTCQNLGGSMEYVHGAGRQAGPPHAARARRGLRRATPHQSSGGPAGNSHPEKLGL